MVEVALIGIYFAFCVYSVYANSKTAQKILELEEENNRFSDALLLPPSAQEGEPKLYLGHSWGQENIETVYHSPLTFDAVKVKTVTCSKCRMVHRHIFNGFSLARKKNLANIEGFYKNGVKCTDSGCLGSEK